VWFARGLTAGRLSQLPYKPNAVRRGARHIVIRPMQGSRGAKVHAANVACYDSVPG